MMRQTKMAAAGAAKLDRRDLAMILDSMGSLWESFRGSKIFVTGGTGFFGCWLLESFAAANDRFELDAEVVVLTRSPGQFAERCPHLAKHSAIRLHPGDMQDFAFPGGEFPFVIHAAADVSAARGNSSRAKNLLAATFDGTRRALDFAASHGTRRFLMVSSGAVYGPQPEQLSHIPETYNGAPNPLLPGSAYGEAKRASEALCGAYAGPNLECPIARPFAFLGPYLPLEQGFAIGDFIRQAIASKPIEIRSDGTALRSYLYAADLAIWLWTLLLKGPSLVPYNVGSGRAISLHDLANTVVEVLSPGLAIQVTGARQPHLPRAQYVPDVGKAATELGLQQTVSLHDAIQRMAAWYGWRTPPMFQQQGALS